MVGTVLQISSEEIERRIAAGDVLMSAIEISKITGEHYQTIMKTWDERVVVSPKRIRWWRSYMLRRLAAASSGSVMA